MERFRSIVSYVSDCLPKSWTSAPKASKALFEEDSFDGQFVATPDLSRSESPTNFLLTHEQEAAKEIPLVPRDKYPSFKLALTDDCYPNGKYTLEGNLDAIRDLAAKGKNFFVGLNKDDAQKLIADPYKRK